MAEYIEREKVLLAVMNAGCTAKTVEVLMNTPAAEVEPVRHGWWEHYSTTMQECSECHRHVARHRFEYCPHCGTRMDGGTDDESAKTHSV